MMARTDSYNATVAARARAAQQILGDKELLAVFEKKGGLPEDLHTIARSGFEAGVVVAISLLLFACGGGSPGGGGSRDDRCAVDITSPLAPPPQDDSAACTPRPGQCPHRGGDALHNWCSDRVPPNVVWNHQIGGPPGQDGQGCDVILGDRHFDAMSWTSKREYWKMWEVTTRDWSNYYKYDDTLRECILRRFVDLFTADCLQVLACNVGIANAEDRFYYDLAIADEGLYHAVSDYFAVPGNLDALRRLRPAGVTDEPMDYCSIDNVQACRR